MNKRNSKLQRLRRFFILAAALLFLLSPFDANAMNEDYLYPEKWENNRHVTVEELNGTSPDETLQGFFSYYRDDHMCLYTYFSVDCTAFDEYRDDVYITFVLHTADEDYTVNVGKDGLCDTLPGSAETVEVGWNFDGRHKGEFLAAVQYLGKESSCTVDVSFYANRTFLVKEGILLERPVTTKPTTVRQTTTKRANRNTTGKSRSGKAGGNNTGRAGTKNRASGEPSTKFVPQGNNYFAETEADTDAVAPTDDIPNAVQGTTAIGSDARTLLLIGLIIAVAGVLVTLYAAISKKTDAPSEAEGEDAAPPEEDV